MPHFGACGVPPGALEGGGADGAPCEGAPGEVSGICVWGVSVPPNASAGLIDILSIFVLLFLQLILESSYFVSHYSFDKIKSPYLTDALLPVHYLELVRWAVVQDYSVELGVDLPERLQHLLRFVQLGPGQ